MLLRSIFVVLLAWLGSVSAANAQALHDPTRGELLYATHCIACHDSQVHWRDRKQAADWKSLRREVRRWQKLGKLGWSNEDIASVTRYLNARYYHYPMPD